MRIKQETIKELNNIINKYIDIFCIKHGLTFDFWVSDLTGTIASFSSQYFFNFEDIRLDLEKEIPPYALMKWYEMSLEQGLNNKVITNYWAFLNLMGLY